MSRLFRLLLLPAGAGAMVAFSRRNREEPQPFFAAVLPDEEPFVAELPATPFPADDALDEPPFVADLRKPDPASAQTDTWSGRAIGS